VTTDGMAPHDVTNETKFKNMLSAGAIMATVIWDEKGFVLVKFLAGETYCCN
jgi:hypothetical protein